MTERRVILVLPTQEALHESAMTRLSNDSRITRRLTGRPARATIDTSFSAIPLGDMHSPSPFAVPRADGGSYYAIRATIDGDAEIPTLTTEGAAIFSDPPITHVASSHVASSHVASSHVASTHVASSRAARPAGTASGTRAEVALRLGVPGLSARRLDGAGVAIAVVDTGINLAHLEARGIEAEIDTTLTWPPLPEGPGLHPVGPGTMCAYAALIAAPRATLLDFPILPSPILPSPILPPPALPASIPRTVLPPWPVPYPGRSGLLSDALQAYARLLAAVRADRSRFKAIVVSNSWGLSAHEADFPAGHPGRYIDNPGHPFNLIVGALSRYGVDILFAAGNALPARPDPFRQGASRPAIVGAAAHPDVLTVTGVSLRGRRTGGAAQGPGIPGMVYAKPDLASYAGFLGSEAGGPGAPDAGTAAACPVAAGCVAALRTRLPHAALGPRDLTVALRTDARRRGPSRWNPGLGYGVMAPLRTAMRLGL
ncbi:S8/S53 family peptidase [Methylobacterium terricola]|uniref:S8/S53 family peptidase n=1 Tax=Methylobacterium terricola TaxID=2583531 RepID=A0A5C4LJ48_9HYPH|nr:S8/S53 family peptidase [Methylobacterium terricola]TNC14261.1 S8/S53 family peptidase [Methylobacterium terricola]